MKLVIPDTVASSQDLAIVIRDIHAYATWAARELIKQKATKKSSGSQPAVSKEGAEIIRAWSGGRSMTKAQIEELVNAVEDYKKSAPTITITLAGVPSGELKAKLVSWCRKELHPTMLVAFRLNRNILGGMVVAYGSHIHDWSFRRKLLEHEKSFHEVLHSV